MDHNDSSSQLRAILNDILGLEDSDSLHCNKDSHGGYGGFSDPYLDTNDEELPNLVDEEMNRYHESAQDEDLSVFNGEEYDHREVGVEEEEGIKANGWIGKLGLGVMCRMIVRAWVHVTRTPYCEIQRQVHFDVVQGVEIYTSPLEKRHSPPHLSKLFLGGYPTMMDEYQQYNAMKKWFDRNCDIALDCSVRCRDLKNILEALFKVYLEWEDDMVVPNVLDLYSDTDARFVRNPRELELQLVSHNNDDIPNAEEQESNIDVQSDDGNGRGSTVVEAEEVVEVEGDEGHKSPT
ncbi:hypothetical protein FXO38_12242 [Capsicum annuum]|nr:hypothetical protein FXO38_12242 [Capsicum annuum]KAF3662726.1 hypothetical protein FXO37_12314 [Capsicum annuum]